MKITTRNLRPLLCLAAVALTAASLLSCSGKDARPAPLAERDPAQSSLHPARSIHPDAWQLSHRPRTLLDGVLAHQRLGLAEPRARPRALETRMVGLGVNEQVVANSRRPVKASDMTHYNPSAPEYVLIKGREVRVLAARAEERGSELSHIRFFEEKRGGSLLSRIVDESIPALSARSPMLKLQDPSLTIMDGDLYIGGVEVAFKNPGDKFLSYRHVIYKAPGRELSALSAEPVFVGDWGKKGTRFERLRDGRYVVVSRPQGEVGGRGKIAWSLIDPIAGETFQQTMDRGIAGAKVLDSHVTAEEWQGPNKLYVLPDGNVMFLSHQASFSGEGNRDRDYVATCFFLDPVSGKHTQLDVILERKDLPGGIARGAKRPDLANVIYTSGFETNRDGSLKLNRDGTATLWFGEGDLLVGRAKVANPLAKG
jgi:hypothetical protein